jgi:hypothetical protein
MESAAVSEVTRILSAIAQGDPGAASQLLPLVYDELRQLAARCLAQQTPGQTLQPTPWQWRPPENPQPRPPW